MWKVGPNRNQRGPSILVVPVVTALIALPIPGLALTLGEIEERGYITVATEDNYPPFEFIRDGEPVGLDHDLYKLLVDYAPFEVRQEIIPWQGLLAGVATGQYDVALSAGTISAQRAEQLDFLMPIAEATHYYIKRKDDANIQSIADLSGRPFGVQQGSSIHQRLDEVDALLQEHGGSLGAPSLYASYPEAFQDLRIGRIDYVLHSIVAAMDLVRSRPDDFEIGEPVVPIGYHAWAVQRGNSELRDFLDDFLRQVRDDGTLYDLQEKWIGVSFPELPWEARLPGDLPIPR
jgi:polar amino acid transport system substrate-binding protein